MANRPIYEEFLPQDGFSGGSGGKFRGAGAHESWDGPSFMEQVAELPGAAATEAKHIVTHPMQTVGEILPTIRSAAAGAYEQLGGVVGNVAEGLAITPEHKQNVQRYRDELASQASAIEGEPGRYSEFGRGAGGMAGFIPAMEAQIGSQLFSTGRKAGDIAVNAMAEGRPMGETAKDIWGQTKGDLGMAALMVGAPIVGRGIGRAIAPVVRNPAVRGAISGGAAFPATGLGIKAVTGDPVTTQGLAAEAAFGAVTGSRHREPRVLTNAEVIAARRGKPTEMSELERTIAEAEARDRAVQPRQPEGEMGISTAEGVLGGEREAAIPERIEPVRTQVEPEPMFLETAEGRIPIGEGDAYPREAPPEKPAGLLPERIMQQPMTNAQIIEARRRLAEEEKFTPQEPQPTEPVILAPENVAADRAMNEAAAEAATRFAEMAKQARKSLRTRRKAGQSGKVYNPLTDLVDAAMIGAEKISKGVRDFGRWSSEMVGEFGESIREHLKSIYDKAVEMFRGAMPVAGQPIESSNNLTIAKRITEDIRAGRIKPEEGRLFLNDGTIPESYRTEQVPTPQQETPAQGVQPTAMEGEAPEGLRHGVNVDHLDLRPEEKKHVWETQDLIEAEAYREGIKISPDELTDAVELTLDNMENPDMANRMKPAEISRIIVSAMISRRQLTDIEQRLSRGEIGHAEYSQKIIGIMNQLQRHAYLAGRLLQSFNVRASGMEGRQSGPYTLLMKMIKQRPELEAQKEEILRRLAEGWKTPGEALKIHNEYVKPRLLDWWNEFRYANMLSSPRSQLRNAYGNLFQVVARFGDLFSINPVAAIKYLGGATRGSTLKKAGSAWANAWKDSDPTNLDVQGSGVQAFRGKAKAFAWPLHLLEANDRLSQTLISEGEMAHGASNTEALRTAREYLYRERLDPTNKSGQGRTLSAIDRVIGAVEYPGRAMGGKLGAVYRAFIPFISTPSRLILKRGLERSPAGLFMTAYDLVTKSYGSKERARIQFSKAIQGTAMYAVASMLAQNGMLTWSAPYDEKQKEEFYKSRRAYSVRMGDKWVPFAYFGPYAVPLAMAAAMNHYQSVSKTSDTDSTAEAWARGIMDMGKFVSDQSFFASLGNLVSIAQGDTSKKTMGALGFTSSQILPWAGLTRWVNEWFDPTYKKSKGFAQTFSSGYPGLQSAFPSEPITDKSGTPATMPTSAHWLYALGEETSHGAEYDRLVEDARNKYTERQENQDEGDHLKMGRDNLFPALKGMGRKKKKRYY